MIDEIKKRIEQLNCGEVPEGYKKTLVGIVPTEWEDNRLINIGVFSKGKGIPGMEMKSDGLPCIGYGDIYTKYNFKFNKAQNYVEQYVAEESVPAEKGTLMFTCSGETAIEIGKCVCYIGNETIYVGGDIAILKLNKKINPLFVAYQQNIFSSIKQKARYSQGHSVVHIYGESLGKLGVAYPKDIVEQQIIAEILTTWDDMVSSQEKLIEKLELQKRGLFQKLLSPKKNWKPVAIGKILKEVVHRTNINNQYPVISSTKLGLFLQNEYFENEIASKDNIGYKILYKEQIVLSPQNLWLGNINYNDKYAMGMVSPSYKVFDIKEKYNKVYVSTVMKTPKMLYHYAMSSEQGASVVRRNLNMDLFNQIVIHIPSRQEQDEISQAISNSESLVNLEKRKLGMIKQQRKTIQQLLLTGIVRVNCIGNYSS